MLPQSKTERLLEERLRKLGVPIERETEFATFKSSDNGVEAALRHADGRDENVSADWLVGCDGAYSAVRGTASAPPLQGRRSTATGCWPTERTELARQETAQRA